MTLDVLSEERAREARALAGGPAARPVQRDSGGGGHVVPDRGGVSSWEKLELGGRPAVAAFTRCYMARAGQMA